MISNEIINKLGLVSTPTDGVMRLSNGKYYISFYKNKNRLNIFIGKGRFYRNSIVSEEIVLGDGFDSFLNHLIEKLERDESKS